MFWIQFSSLTEKELVEIAAQTLQTELPDWEKNIWQFVSDWFNPSIPSIKVFTSGSTGAPKQIEHTKQAMLNSAQMTCETLQLQKGDNALLCLPVTKIAGMMMVVRSLHAGLNLYCIEPSATPLKQLTGDIQFALAAFTPMQLHSATKDYPQFLQAEAIQKIILGGERVSAEVLDIVRRWNNDVYATFGMTETISHIALKKLNGANVDAHFKVLQGIKISTGEENRLIIEAPELGQPHLLTNDIVRIVMPRNEASCISPANEIQDFSLRKAFVRNDKTHLPNTFGDNTNNSNQEFDWLGRTDNVINTGGVKIHPEELEQLLQPHIQPAYFIGAVPDERTGDKLVLAIEMTALSESDKQALKQAFETFPKLQRPKAVLLFNQFVRTSNGKINRKETMQSTHEVVMLAE